MRAPLLAAFASILAFSSAALADDTRPPQISDVKASAKGNMVTVEARITDETGVLSAACHHRAPGGPAEDTPMVKDEFSDLFRATFTGGGETEYWIEATDLLGNGPSAYGSPGKAYAVGGKPSTGGGKAVASAEPVEQRKAPPPRQQPKEAKPARERPQRVARSSPPVIEHRKPTLQAPEGRELTLRVKIRSEVPVGVAVLQARPQGSSQSFTTSPLTSAGGDSYEGQIPASLARGSVEYFIVAKNDAGEMTHQGDGDTHTPYVIAFKAPAAAQVVTEPAAAAATTSATAAKASPPPRPAATASPYTFTDLPPYRVAPGRPITVRAQVVPAGDGQAPETVAILWRGNGSQDQMTEMSPDETGGWGGYKAQLPPQEEGAVFFQIVACDAQASRCGVDTGSKRKWHATTVAANPGTPQPMALDAVSSKAPPTLPE